MDLVITPINQEFPCKVGFPNKACVWEDREIYDENGELESWDLYCQNCFRWRDWTLEEFQERKQQD